MFNKPAWPILAFLVLTSCSAARPPAPIPLSELGAVELFISRRHFNDTDFEQFKLDHKKLFFECGAIKRGRFMAQEQKLIELNSEQWSNLSTLANSAENSIKNEKFDAPGDNSWIADPGQFQLSISTAVESKIKTSLDSISSSSTAGEHSLHDLASAIRTMAGGLLCGNKTFFGLK